MHLKIHGRQRPRFSEAPLQCDGFYHCGAHSMLQCLSMAFFKSAAVRFSCFALITMDSSGSPSSSRLSSADYGGVSTTRLPMP
ncbi:MAG: hypothetical protein KDN05_07710, partial [Verrucomicrobiae bacterium]|nr:hypothetical protein [Verrucomicrobiae bacterium]